MGLAVWANGWGRVAAVLTAATLAFGAGAIWMIVRRLDGKWDHPSVLNLARAAAILSLLLMGFAWVRASSSAITAVVAIVGFLVTAILVIFAALLAGSRDFRRRTWHSATLGARLRFVLLLVLNTVG